MYSSSFEKFYVIIGCCEDILQKQWSPQPIITPNIAYQ